MKLFTIPSTILILVVTFLPLGNQDKPVPEDPYIVAKASSVRKVIEIVSKLERLGRLNANEDDEKYVNGYLSQTSVNEIESLLKELPDSDQLTRLGLICGHLAYPQNASHVSYDAVFDFALWEVAEILSQRTDDAAVRGLELLRQSHGSDGHPSEYLSELMQKQSKLSPSSQSKSRKPRHSRKQ